MRSQYLEVELSWYPGLFSSLLWADMEAVSDFLVVWGLCAVTREFLEPKLMGSRFDVNPFYMIMATFIGMELFGLLGIILGPLAIVMIREILRLIYKKRWSIGTLRLFPYKSHAQSVTDKQM